jgi:hypothetical protein
MALVAILTQEQKDSIQDQYLTDGWIFNCSLDINNNWTLGQPQIDACTVEEYQWVKTLPLVEWVAPLPTPPTTGSL